MNYTRQLPKFSDLRRLAQAVDEFPASISRVVAVARTIGMGSEVIGLLKLFHGEFETKADLYARTSELVLLIQEENKQPEEGVLSPQD
ncbi:MAG TPA: hypothetical protein VFW77_03655 [Candidatus Saccharimonadales bacterium]|nr:hypothetical protein [Candidatus Saccharimonadales bacterium]